MRAAVTVWTLLFAMLASAPLAWAQMPQWTVVQAQGSVHVESPGLSRIAVRPNERLVPGSTVTTGPNGHSILTNGESAVQLRPNTRLVLPSSFQGERTILRQDFGSALFKVNKRPNAHFEVNTPHLAAVVKGTTFGVTLTAMEGTVEVDGGLVEVWSTDRTERVLAAAGRRVKMSARKREPGQTRGTQTAGSGIITAAITPMDAPVLIGSDKAVTSAFSPEFKNPAIGTQDDDAVEDESKLKLPQPVELFQDRLRPGFDQDKGSGGPGTGDGNPGGNGTGRPGDDEQSGGDKAEKDEKDE
ncbi:MAG TPA: hypothetical protein DCL48_12005, partial [Alphaproteobacteria bacterium]|nr:hypothetical protein [Alphaproteobacteria bacterium]